MIVKDNKIELNTVPRMLEIDKLVEKMKFIKLSELKDFFTKHSLVFNRKVRMKVMRSVLRPFVLKTRMECLTLDSRLNYRLLWFNVFSEYQMCIFFNQFKEARIKTKYLTKFYRAIIIDLSKEDKNEKIILELEKLSEKSEVQGEKQNPSPLELNEEFKGFFIDEADTLDGLTVDEFRPILYNSATKDQLVGLGKKYDVLVPDKLSGDGLREYVRGLLVLDNNLTEENTKILTEGRVTDVKNLAIKYNIKLAIELNKKETIEFILQRASTTKDNYKKPISEQVYEMSIPINDDEKRYEKLLSEASMLELELTSARNDLVNLKDQEREALEKVILEKQKQAEEHNKALEELQKRLDETESSLLEEKNKPKETVFVEKEFESKYRIHALLVTLFFLCYFGLAAIMFCLLYFLVK